MKKCDKEFKMNWVGYAAVLFTIVGAVAQILLINERKSAGDLSYISIGSRFLIIGLWLTYAIINKIKPSIVSGIIGIILIGVLTGYKYKYDNISIGTLEVWGPRMWNTMHTFSYTYEPDSDERKKGAIQFYESIEYMIPCETCRTQYRAYVRKNPVRVDSKEELITWVIEAHNEVNNRSKKKTWTREMANRKYVFK